MYIKTQVELFTETAEKWEDMGIKPPEDTDESEWVDAYVNIHSGLIVTNQDGRCGFNLANAPDGPLSLFSFHAFEKIISKLGLIVG